jgi:predicted MFS family arabinose efflux permease
LNTNLASNRNTLSAAPVPTPAPSPGARTDWGIVFLAIFAGIATSFQIGKFAPALPLMQGDLGLSLLASGWLSSLIAVIGAFGALFVGILIGRFSGLAGLAAGLIILTGGGVLGSIAETAPLAFLARGIESLGFVLTAVSAPRVIVSHCQARDQGLALGIWGSYMATGSALAMVLAPVLFSFAGWRSLWWFGAFLSGTAALISLAAARYQHRVTVRKSPSASASVSWAVLRNIVLRQGPWYLAGVFICYSALYFAVTTWLPSFLIEDHGMTTSSASLIGGLVVAANILGNLAGGWLMYRGFRRVHLISAGLCLMGLMSIFIFPDVMPLGLRISAAVGLSLFGGLVPSSLLASAPHHAATPAALSIVNGIIVQGANIGNLSGAPYLAAALTWLGSWQMMWLPLLLLVVLGLGAVRLLDRAEKRQG